jgi:hypothetical protein
MAATTAVFDFRDEDTLPLEGSMEPVTFGSHGGIIGRPISSTQAKQIRQRARRKKKELSELEIGLLYKPIEEWDMEELARGRPRAKDGTFKGKTPPYIDRKVHEQVVKRFEEIVRKEMNANTVDALKIIKQILDDDGYDDKGKPTTSANTKLDAAKFLIEHVIGKPKQRTETDISVKLQGILGMAMVQPSVQTGNYELTQGYVEAASWEEDDEVEHDGGE